MIITRTPLRVSFAGGMSDIPAYYEKDFGCILSTAINKYIYITVNERLENFWRIKYSRTENVDTVGEIKHRIIRACLEYMEIKEPLEITAVSEVPSKTGLGSSSAFTVGLLHALHRYTGEYSSPVQLAEEACHIEIDTLKEPIGKQDQYAAALGGTNAIYFAKGNISIKPIHLPKAIRDDLSMYYLGRRPASRHIHEDIAVHMEKKRPAIDVVRNVAVGLYNDLIEGMSPECFGAWLNMAWHTKKQVSSEIDSPAIADAVRLAISHGATGCKLLGEGGSGFLLVYGLDTPITELKHMPIEFEVAGSYVVYDGD